MRRLFVYICFLPSFFSSCSSNGVCRWCVVLSKIFDSVFQCVRRMRCMRCVCVFVCLFFCSFFALDEMLNFEFLSKAPNIGEKARAYCNLNGLGRPVFAPIQPHLMVFYVHFNLRIFVEMAMFVWCVQFTYVLRLNWYLIVRGQKPTTFFHFFFHFSLSSLGLHDAALFVHAVYLSIMCWHTWRSSPLSNKFFAHAHTYTHSQTCYSSSIPGFFFYLLHSLLFDCCCYLIEHTHFWLLIAEKRSQANSGQMHKECSFECN